MRLYKRFAKQGLGEMPKREILLRAIKKRKLIERPDPEWADKNRKKKVRKRQKERENEEKKLKIENDEEEEY